MEFYWLSFLTGICEIGCICWGYSQKIPIELILFLGVAYQTGNMFPVPFRLKRKHYVIMGQIGVIVCLCSMVLGGYINFLCITIAVASCSICLQVSRSLTKEECNTTIKRIIRLLGFLCAPICTGYFKIVLCIALISALTVIWKKEMLSDTKNYSRWENIHSVMFFHQMHYFTYAYGVLLYVMEKEGMKGAVLCFVATWVTYMIMSPILLSSGKKEYFKWFFAGHILLSMILTGMCLVVYNMKLYIILWVIAGMGGGTVFCITAIGKQISEDYNPKMMTLAENCGHWCGSILATAVIGITRNIQFLTAISVCFVVLAILIMKIGVGRYDS